jgi:hypothetical protein
LVGSFGVVVGFFVGVIAVGFLVGALVEVDLTGLLVGFFVGFFVGFLIGAFVGGRKFVGAAVAGLGLLPVMVTVDAKETGAGIRGLSISKEQHRQSAFRSHVLSPQLKNCSG